MMKNTCFVFVVICLSAFILAACHKNTPTETNAIERTPIVPLSVGNSWFYSGVTYDTLGSIIEPFLESVVISKDSLISNKRYFLYNILFSINTDTGLVSIDGQTKNYYYKYPVLLGETFHSILAVDFYVSCLDTIIQVPAGTFHCLRYEAFYGDVRIESFFLSPGTGEIKLITYQSAFSQKNDQRVYLIHVLESDVIN